MPRKYLKRTRKRKATKVVARKPKQWYRPGHAKMATYRRVGPHYIVTGQRMSQYKPRKVKYVAFVPPHSDVPSIGTILTEGSGSMDLDTGLRPLVVVEQSRHGFGGVAARRARRELPAPSTYYAPYNTRRRARIGN